MQKLCACGCGQPAPIATQTNKTIGHIKGEQVRYIKGHVRYNGGIARHTKGYLLIRKPDHPRSGVRGYVAEHILLAEKALGKPLPPNAVVHHSNGDLDNNHLVICQDNAYHKLLHLRMKALKECGHADWRKCRFCKQWDDPEKLYINPANNGVHHRECYKNYYNENREHFNELQRKRRTRRKLL